MSNPDERGTWPIVTLPEGWSWIAFDEAWSDFTESTRKLPQKSYLPFGRYAVVDQGEKEIGGYSDDAELLSRSPLPAIIFGDHTRAVKFIEDPFIQGADGVRVLVPSKVFYSKFAHLVMRAVSLPNKGYSRHYKFLKATNFPVPPIPEQERIVAKIDSLSAKLKRARDHLDHLPHIIKRYKEAVLDTIFDQIVSPNIQLREITKFVTSGSRGWATFYSDSGPLFIRVANVTRGHVDLNFHDKQHVAPPANIEGTRTLVLPGDVVITITADLGRIGVIPGDLGEAYVNQHVALVRLRDPTEGRFVAWYLTSPGGQKQLLERDRGVTRAGLGLDDIRMVEVPVIDATRQAATVRRIEAAFSWIDRLASEATSARKLIDHLNQAILAKALRGELAPQNLGDEPASALLERIKAKKTGSAPVRRGRGRPRLATAT